MSCTDATTVRITCEDGSVVTFPVASCDEGNGTPGGAGGAGNEPGEEPGPGAEGGAGNEEPGGAGGAEGADTL